MAQLFEVERERRRGDVQRIGNRADGGTFGSGFDEEPEDIETRALRQRSEGNESGIRFHVSMIMET